MSLEEKSADAAERRKDHDAGGGEGEGGSAIAAGIRRDVRPWLNLVDDLSNLTRDAEISVPQVCVCGLFRVHFASFDFGCSFLWCDLSVFSVITW